MDAFTELKTVIGNLEWKRSAPLHQPVGEDLPGVVQRLRAEAASRLLWSYHLRRLHHYEPYGGGAAPGLNLYDVAVGQVRHLAVELIRVAHAVQIDRKSVV